MGDVGSIPGDQGGYSNTGNVEDNSFRNIDKLNLGSLLQSKSLGRMRKFKRVRESGMPEIDHKFSGGLGKLEHGPRIGK